MRFSRRERGCNKVCIQCQGRCSFLARFSTQCRGVTKLGTIDVCITVNDRLLRIQKCDGIVRRHVEQGQIVRLSRKLQEVVYRFQQKGNTQWAMRRPQSQRYTCMHSHAVNTVHGCAARMLRPLRRSTVQHKRPGHSQGPEPRPRALGQSPEPEARARGQGQWPAPEASSRDQG